MGALPKRRTSTGRKGKRRNSIKLGKINVMKCPHCGGNKLSHQLCKTCGK